MANVMGMMVATTTTAGVSSKKDAVTANGEMGNGSISELPDETNRPNPVLGAKYVPLLMATVLACWINLACGASLGFTTPALSDLKNNTSHLTLSEEEGTWMASLSMLGAMIGGLCAGPAISFGRKKALWIAVFPLCAAWVLIVFAQAAWYLCVAQAIMGFSTGVVSDAAQLYVSETSTRRWRGALGCIPVLMFNAGMLVCYIAAYFMSWWTLAAFGACLTLPSVLAPCVLPETPVFLATKGKMKEACAALRWFRGPECDMQEELQQLQYVASLGRKGRPSLKGCVKVWRLLDKTLMKPFFHTLGIRILSRFCGIRPISSYLESIFSSTGSSINKEITTIASGVAQIVGTVIACVLLHRIGRRSLLIWSQIVMGVSLVGLGLCIYFSNFFINQETDMFGWLPFAAVVVYVVSNSVGLAPVSGIILSEIVPQRFRSITSSSTGALSWLSAFIVTKCFYVIEAGLKLHGAIWVFSVMCVLGAVYVYFLLPETRGLTQYEIDNLFVNDAEKNDEDKGQKQEATETV
ncbi:facilitated trehalose transporter Tret1 [Anabrus simplex]|uniref:facilitated trehalose transporter Tret1 n=1 Tax=Anabrus simplex TaxID=316456 RepID=UPI0035A353A6